MLYLQPNEGLVNTSLRLLLSNCSYFGIFFFNLFCVSSLYITFRVYQSSSSLEDHENIFYSIDSLGLSALDVGHVNYEFGDLHLHFIYNQISLPFKIP